MAVASTPALVRKRVNGHSSKTKAVVKATLDALAASPINKVVIFSQWTSYLDLLEDALYGALAGDPRFCSRSNTPNRKIVDPNGARETLPTLISAVQYVRMDGDVHNTEKREEILERFRNLPNCRILLTTLQAGGLGVNLVCANHVILPDTWFNPYSELQAQERLHRIGQDKTVTVIRVHADASIEKAVLEIQKRKTDAASYFLEGHIQPKGAGGGGGGGGAGGGGGLNEQELHSVFQLLLAKRRIAMAREKEAAAVAPTGSTLGKRKYETPASASTSSKIPALQLQPVPPLGLSTSTCGSHPPCLSANKPYASQKQQKPIQLLDLTIDLSE